ncbi:MAG TPA: hypothetical protein VME66_01580 [Candidatus Acidoferrales bacterium]|nr:hypothetical protein [Candidatus Acidoferrales bacterium]
MQAFYRPSSTLWATALLVAGLASDLFLTCGSNLVAFAVIAALTLPFRTAVLIATGVWLESQVLGFTLFAYPHTPMTFAWGLALGAATLVAVAAGAAFRTHNRVVTFLGAFACYEVVVALFALASHAGLHGFAPAVIGELLVRNALTALVLAALSQLVRLAVPAKPVPVSAPRS